MFTNLVNKLFYLPIVLLSLSVHELCHGYAALKLGDDTAKDMGRLTINPLAHLDIIGTVAMLFFGFGWAKPVPVNFSKLKWRKLGPLFVALAGPLSNLFLALVSFLILVFLSLNGITPGGFAASYLSAAVSMNVILAVFNLLPIPPLDGSKVVMSLLPYKWQFKVYRVEIYIQIVLFALLYIGVLDPVINAVSQFAFNLLSGVVFAIVSLFFKVKNFF